ncbi:MAG: hypothetical protein WBO10_03140 [Pyrinomonadaceae bacterium]
MFCPECGIEERSANQFCRACGVDLRRVRGAVGSSDTVTASAASARDEIGRAVAARIRETHNASELKKVAENVLPEVEKFLESPEEKRMRRMRTGTILSFIGLGTAIGISVVSVFMNDRDVIFLAALGVVAFFIGLAFILNGIFLSVPKKNLTDRSSDADSQRVLDGVSGTTSDLHLPQATAFSSVTEHTTRHLKEEQPVRRGRAKQLFDN